MKKYFLLLGFILLFHINYAQSNLETENLALFCKVWGFLKYYHPYPSEKNVDWDTVLVNNYPKIKASQSKEEFNKIILSIIQPMGELKHNQHPFVPADSCAKNADFKWMDDTTILSKQVCNYLLRVKKNHKPFKNKYLGTNFNGDTKLIENPYSEMHYPDEGYRFLSLARYWNIINYCFPDKYLMDTDWNSSLEKAIPIFINAANILEYYRALEWITARTNDSHAAYVIAPNGPYGLRFMMYLLPFNILIHHDTFSICHILNDSIANTSHIKNGDELMSINGKSIKDIWQDVKEHHSASNESYAEFIFTNGDLLRSYKDTSEIVIKRDSKEINMKVKNYTFMQEVAILKHPSANPVTSFHIRTDTISGKKYGYINLGILRNKELKDIFLQMKGIDYLILDNRNYPIADFNKLAKKIVHGRHYVASYTQPDYEYPGYIKYHQHPYVASFTKKVGTNKKSYYKGKIIILVDHKTQSAAEYRTMALRLAKHSTVIGTQTAGADGDISTIIFPGNYSNNFTGLGWFYADWGQTQRIGIVPDITVDYTLQSELKGIDPIMQRALEYIRTGE